MNFPKRGTFSSDDSMTEQQPVEDPTAPKVYTMTIQADKGGDAATTRTLYFSDKTLKVTWELNEVVKVAQQNADGEMVEKGELKVIDLSSSTLRRTLRSIRIV